jgi:hypothetical protein
VFGKRALRIKYDVFSFDNFKSTKCCLSVNGLNLIMWAELSDIKAQILIHDPQKKDQKEFFVLTLPRT